MTREFLEELMINAQRKVDSPVLEDIICTQEDASLQSPGVPAHYYRFLYRLAQVIKLNVSLELGTHTGISAMCLAEGNPEGQVITVNNRDELTPGHRRANVQYRIHDSLLKIEQVQGIDLLFIDTAHDGIRCMLEYRLYESCMNRDGVIFFDDIYLLDCMKIFWNTFMPIRGEKFELPVHGWAGFGVVLLDGQEPQKEER